MRARPMRAMLRSTMACYRAAQAGAPAPLPAAPTDAAAYKQQMAQALAYEAGVEIAQVVPADKLGDAVLPAPVDMAGDTPGLLASRAEDGTCHVLSLIHI